MVILQELLNRMKDIKLKNNKENNLINKRIKNKPLRILKRLDIHKKKNMIFYNIN